MKEKVITFADDNILYAEDAAVFTSKELLKMKPIDEKMNLAKSLNQTNVNKNPERLTSNLIPVKQFL